MPVFDLAARVVVAMLFYLLLLVTIVVFVVILILGFGIFFGFFFAVVIELTKRVISVIAFSRDFLWSRIVKTGAWATLRRGHSEKQHGM